MTTSKSEEKKTLADTILEYWEQDSKMDRHDPSGEAVNIPKLHFKYLNLLKQVNQNLVKLRKRKKILYREKSLYYSGKADDDTYRRDNFHLKVLKGDLDTFISSDDEFSSVVAKIEEYEGIQEIVKSILSMIKDRNWQIRSIIEWDKFTSGS
jgi:hypothetical protein